MTLLLLSAFLTLPAGISMLALATLGALTVGTFVHSGAYDTSAQTDILGNCDSQVQVVALTASGTFAAGQLTGANDISLVNTTATPGTVTTRTAAQMYADLQAAFGLQNLIGFQYNLRIFHTAAGTLTIGTGTGVTLGATGTNTVATATWRDYVVTVVSPISITIQTTGSGTP